MFEVFHVVTTAEVTEATFLIVLLIAPVFITQALQPYIVKHDNGRIIILSSVSARLGQVSELLTLLAQKEQTHS